MMTAIDRGTFVCVCVCVCSYIHKHYKYTRVFPTWATHGFDRFEFPPINFKTKRGLSYPADTIPTDYRGSQNVFHRKSRTGEFYLWALIKPPRR